MIQYLTYCSYLKKKHIFVTFHAFIAVNVLNHIFSLNPHSVKHKLLPMHFSLICLAFIIIMIPFHLFWPLKLQ